MSNNRITTVEFGSETIWAIERDGEVYIAITPICAALGIDPRSQRRRIEDDPIMFEGRVMMTLPSGNGAQETLCLRLDLLNGWLFRLETRRVKLAARDAVLRYQRECYRVLFAHFYGAAKRPRPAHGGHALDLDRIVALLHQHQLRVYEAVHTMRGGDASMQRVAYIAGLSIEAAYRHVALLALLGLLQIIPDDQLADLMGVARPNGRLH
ncbi:MAG TPA: phage antirepressor N-terminal domain-containing protein [Stellaceae bacterium]|jgi:hypothetical protein